MMPCRLVPAAALVLLAAGLSAAAEPPAAKPPAATDRDKLQGTWKVSAEVEDGRESPAARCGKVRLVFAADKLLLKEGDEVQEAAFTLDATRTPRVIELVPAAGPHKGKKLSGIYALEGDTLRVCLPTEPGKEAPADFGCRPGSGRILLTLQRDK
jgi:uncharacterized protein (TIGR03067 family)